MNSKQMELVRQTCKEVAPIADSAAELFYTKLFTIDPALRPVFVSQLDNRGHRLMQMVEAAAEAGARGATFIPVRLPHEVAPLFRAWLDEHYPDRAAKVMSTIQSLRGGKDNDPNFFTRMRGAGPWAELIRTRFEIACRKHNLPRLKIPLRPDLFEPPQGDQLRLF